MFMLIKPLVLCMHVVSKDALRLGVDGGLPVVPDAMFKAHLGCDDLHCHRMTGVRRGVSYEYEFSSSYNPRTVSRCRLIG
jgi:hypothetical protein